MKVQRFKVRSKTDLEPSYSPTHHANKSSRWAEYFAG